MSASGDDRSGHLSGTARGAPGQRQDAPLRGDAARNRARILAAAREQLASPGELRLSAVARASGVGQGTLYRHFPTREALLGEVYRAEVAELVAAAPALLAAAGPGGPAGPAGAGPGAGRALDALAAWLGRVAAYARVKREVFAAVEAGVWQGLAAHSLGPIGQAVEELLAAGRADGSVRDDVQARDVVVLISWLSRLEDDELDERGPRLLGVLVDGLAPPRGR